MTVKTLLKLLKDKPQDAKAVVSIMVNGEEIDVDVAYISLRTGRKNEVVIHTI